MANLLYISSNQLTFPLISDSSVTTVIKLSNLTDEYVAFKMKTTNPKRYSVKPNLSIIPPNSSADVSVTVSYRSDPPLIDDKDKFQIQSVVFSGDPNTQVNELKEQWQSFDDESIRKQRVTCKFLQNSQPEISNEAVTQTSREIPNPSSSVPQGSTLTPSTKPESEISWAMILLACIIAILAVLLGIFFFRSFYLSKEGETLLSFINQQ